MPDVAGLFDSFLEAAVSLAVLFVIVAWVSSKIVELGQLTFNVHGKMLRDELERCFGEDGRNDPNKGRFTRYFYWHPMIVPLTQPSALVSLWRRLSGGFASDGSEPVDVEARFPPGRLPGHIAPESFAAVVMNPFPWPTTKEPLRRLLKANLLDEPDPAYTPITGDDFENAIDKLIRRGQSLTPGETWRALLQRLALALPLNDDFLDGRVDIHGPAGGGGGDPAERYIAMCRANELVPHPLETRIVTLLRDADSDLDEFRSGLRRWYAEAMSRVTGRFKRTALVWVFFVALIICTLFNLNAINLFSALMKSPELRAAGVAASQSIGSRPGGIEALGQKVAFRQTYPCVKSATPIGYDCRRNLLQTLWRDSRRFNVVTDIFPVKEPPRKVSEDVPTSAADRSGDEAAGPNPKVDTVALAQVRAVQGLCDNDPGLCASGFKARLDACAKGDGTYESARCPDAWDAIWTTSGFFWHPEAAQKLALSLSDRLSTQERDGLSNLLARLDEQARAETEAITKFLNKLPIAGPVWKDEDFNGFGALWILFGVLLSALLAALGAPFWYDVLGKLTRRGTSGARGEKT